MVNGENMPDYTVTIESAWLVRDVKSLDDAIGIAISEAGKRLNPAAKFVEVEAGFDLPVLRGDPFKCHRSSRYCTGRTGPRDESVPGRVRRACRKDRKIRDR